MSNNRTKSRLSMILHWISALRELKVLIVVHIWTVETRTTLFASANTGVTCEATASFCYLCVIPRQNLSTSNRMLHTRCRSHVLMLHPKMHRLALHMMMASLFRLHIDRSIALVAVRDYWLVMIYSY